MRRATSGDAPNGAWGRIAGRYDGAMNPEDVDRLAALLLRTNEDPGSRDLHTWGTPHDALAAEIRGLERPVIVLEDGGRGVMILDVAIEKARAWAWGPAVEGDDRPVRADALLDEALRRLPPGIERVSAYPASGSWIEAWWRGRGARAGDVVHVYRAGRQDVGRSSPEVRDAAPADLPALTPLHDAAFPKTYLSAAEMLDAGRGRRVLVTPAAGPPAGYACAEARLDETGYVHYLAVDPARRRQGLGRRLLLAALHWLHVERGLRETVLTVADRNDARDLYAQAGFTRIATGQPIDLPIGPR